MDKDGAGGHPEVTGAPSLRGKRPGHARQSAPARWGGGLPAPVPHLVHGSPPPSKCSAPARGLPAPILYHSASRLPQARTGQRLPVPDRVLGTRMVCQEPKGHLLKENLEVGSFKVTDLSFSF